MLHYIVTGEDYLSYASWMFIPNFWTGLKESRCRERIVILEEIFNRSPDFFKDRYISFYLL